MLFYKKKHLKHYIMTIEDFTNAYSSEYMFIFHNVKKVVAVEQPKKSTFSKISDFLFEPVYEVNNLNFKVVA